jgi:KDO2-lipid IV(A) lauroyltransferase
MGARHHGRPVEKSVKSLQHRIEYALVRCVETFLFLMPRAVALKVGDALGLLMWAVLASRRRLAMSNLASAFPRMSVGERARLVRHNWKNIGRTAVEFIRVTDINESNWNDYFIVEGRENLTKAERMDKGVVLATFHFSNWEMFAIGTGHLLGSGTAIARPMKNPYVEKWVQAKRATGHVSIILHRQAVKASLKILKAKGHLGILVDQNLYTGGVFVDFFGQPAATTTLPALLNERTGAPVLIAYCVREGKKFRLVYEPVLKLSSSGTQEERLMVNTQLISSELERIIRKSPENWFWIHNRWKRKQAA